MLFKTRECNFFLIWCQKSLVISPKDAEAF